jgi:chemotaxis signal transduction protein
VRFGLPTREATLDSRVVVVKSGERAVGLLVDSAREVLRVDPEKLRPAPEVIGGASAGFVKSVVQLGADGGVVQGARATTPPTAAATGIPRPSGERAGAGRLLMLIDFDKVIGKEVSEDIATGVAPAFQSDGFTRPADVALIDAGALVGALVSPRTAREFALSENGANPWEAPEALSMRGGALATSDALRALDTGLAVGNLWYLNYSDRPACRMTGMTRFATFWVENGRIVAPVDVLRFDDTLYRMFGDNLEALTEERELLLESNTYGSRLLTSFVLPGALVSEMSFTL